nr:hypothetical protein [Methylicorpusculum oleiharenae]
MKTVVDHWPVDSIKDVGSLLSAVWDKPAGELGGKIVSLGELEHKTLRRVLALPYSSSIITRIYPALKSKLILITTGPLTAVANCFYRCDDVIFSGKCLCPMLFQSIVIDSSIDDKWATGVIDSYCR